MKYKEIFFKWERNELAIQINNINITNININTYNIIYDILYIINIKFY